MVQRSKNQKPRQGGITVRQICARRRVMGPHLESQSSRKLRLAVLRGGTSAERVISLKSGQAVSRALVELGHAVHEIDPAVIDVSCCDWGAFDAAFVALHGKFGEDGQIQE